MGKFEEIDDQPHPGDADNGHGQGEQDEKKQCGWIGFAQVGIDQQQQRGNKRVHPEAVRQKGGKRECEPEISPSCIISSFCNAASWSVGKCKNGRCEDKNND